MIMEGENTGPLEILYDNGPCLVVNKRSGLLTQAPVGIDSLEVQVKDFFRRREGKLASAKIYLGLPHRLDRPVSGAIVMARHVRAARKLSSQFENRTVQKVYWALVEGRVEPDEGTWIDTLHKRHAIAQAEVVHHDHPAGKNAVLHYRVRRYLRKQGVGTHLPERPRPTLRVGYRSFAQKARCFAQKSPDPLFTWLEVHLETGRTHQIRVQASSRGHAVLGDGQYCSDIPFGIQHEDLRDRAIALHARELAFGHPMTQEPVHVTAPLPAVWDEFMSEDQTPPT
jgi:23S rRNA pseudouridine1911/1915/1917 synthase